MLYSTRWIHRSIKITRQSAGPVRSPVQNRTVTLRSTQ